MPEIGRTTRVLRLRLEPDWLLERQVLGENLSLVLVRHRTMAFKIRFVQAKTLANPISSPARYGGTWENIDSPTGNPIWGLRFPPDLFAKVPSTELFRWLLDAGIISTEKSPVTAVKGKNLVEMDALDGILVAITDMRPGQVQPGTETHRPAQSEDKRPAIYDLRPGQVQPGTETYRQPGTGSPQFPPPAED